MDVDKLMKNDELSNLATRPCTKESDPNDCRCAKCVYQNGIVNQQKEILNDEKSPHFAANALNQPLGNANLAVVLSNGGGGSSRKTLNPLATIKSLISATTGHSNATTTTTNSRKSELQVKANHSPTAANHPLSNNNHVSCPNHQQNGGLMPGEHNALAIVKSNAKFTETDLNGLHADDETLFMNGSHEWYAHCHQTDDSKLNTDRSDSANRRLLITTVLCGFFLITELVGGYISNSLSIMTDAAHLLSDIVSFGLSLFAVYLSKKRPTKRFTFGYQRAEILGAICSILLIWVLTAVVVYFAIIRIITMDFEIESTVMMVVALFGIAVNILMGITLHGCMCPGFGCLRGHSHSEEEDEDGLHHYQAATDGGRQLAKQQPPNGKRPNDKHHIELEIVSTDTSENGINLNKIDAENSQKKLANIKRTKNDHNHSHRHGHHSHNHDHESINVRAAIIHVLGDLIQSVGVFVAAIIIMVKPEWKIADPICTFLFSVIVMFTTVRIMKESILIIMESAPDHIDHQAVKLSLLNINGVKMVHNLYIWQLTVNNVVLAGHLVVTANCNIEQVLQKARILLKEQHNITTATIQCERYQPQIMLACDHCNEL